MAKEYIEREAAIQYFKKRSKSFIGHEPIPPALVIMGCANEVDAIPAADVRPVVRGKWLKRDDMPRIAECKCSVCLYADYPSKSDRYWFERNYCPNCGAKMEVQDG